MSILIKGLDLPEKIESEMVIEFVDDIHGKRYARVYDYKFGGLTNWCEVVSVPPHGDLIDRDAFMKENEYFTDRDFNNPQYDTTLRELVDIAPVIIPADKEKT